MSEEQLQALYADIPFGLPEEPTPKAGSGASRAFSVDGYGLDTWRKLFTNRQLLASGQRVCARRLANCRGNDNADLFTLTEDGGKRCGRGTLALGLERPDGLTTQALFAQWHRYTRDNNWAIIPLPALRLPMVLGLLPKLIPVSRTPRGQLIELAPLNRVSPAFDWPRKLEYPGNNRRARF